jgi:hypothetical protein
MGEHETLANVGCGRPVGWAGAMPVRCGRMAILCRRCKGLPASDTGSQVDR